VTASDEENDMQVDPQSLVPAPGGNGAAGPQRDDTQREQWLSALEQESFTLSDETLPDGAASAGAPRLSGIVDPEAPEDVSAPRDPFATAAELAGLFTPPGARASAGIPPVSGMSAAQRMQPVIPEPRGLEGWQIATLSSGGTRSPDANGLRLAQRYDALMNQMRFTDVNVRLTQSGGELTLWIRDFRQKYAAEVFNWVRDLQGLLAEQGSSLSRIMVNGKRITHINELLGASSWQ
jgi:hypothetical protein